jgi:hypothetical protein
MSTPLSNVFSWPANGRLPLYMHLPHMGRLKLNLPTTKINVFFILFKLLLKNLMTTLNYAALPYKSVTGSCLAKRKIERNRRRREEIIQIVHGIIVGHKLT